MNVVWLSSLPPVGPSSVPIDCSKTQAIASLLGQLIGSEPPGIAFTFWAQTLLLSKELCQVTLPMGNGLGAFPLGLVSGLRKCVMICTSCPKNFTKRVAS